LANFCTLLALVLAVASPQAKPVSLDPLCKQFKSFDQNHDGIVEIKNLKPLGSAGQGGERVVMLVEQRLLSDAKSAAQLKPVLQRWADDLGQDGFRADVVAIELGRAKQHQDGRFILAIREFLRAVQRESKLAGVVLVGHFPDAMLVRTCSWHRTGDVTLHYKKPDQKTYKAVRYVQRKPEVIAQRADIVLGDLDGRWEDVYIQEKTSLPSEVAVFEGKVPPGGGPCVDFEKGSKPFEDMFCISDGSMMIAEAAGAETGPVVTLSNDGTNRECATSDFESPNPIARPDILVSRLDARGVAYRPRAKIVGTDGKRLLDAQGKPQAIQFAAGAKIPASVDELWELDPQLERQLLVEYFDRNHAYRTGTAKIAWRPASIACELGSGYRSMQQAATNWAATDPKQADVRGKPTLVQFVDWIEYPAVLRTVRAHSDPMRSKFRKANIAQLDAHLGGPAWAWTKKGDRLEPSLEATNGNGMLSWSLLHSLYQNGQIPEEPCFYQHGGCNAISPNGAGGLSYDNPQYGKRNGAESLLMFGNGLALLGRAKVYYDEPAGFGKTLREGHTFGSTWANYFTNEASGASSRGAGDIGRKRAYFWSVLGDWTLRLSTAAPKTTAAN
jgi:hypothetical protein